MKRGRRPVWRFGPPMQMGFQPSLFGGSIRQEDHAHGQRHEDWLRERVQDKRRAEVVTRYAERHTEARRPVPESSCPAAEPAGTRTGVAGATRPGCRGTRLGGFGGSDGHRYYAVSSAGLSGGATGSGVVTTFRGARLPRRGVD